LLQVLRELGYVEGHNLALEYRWAEGQLERLPALAAELVHLQVDVIVAGPNMAIAAAQQATRAIPIVMVVGADPVGVGFIASLARPGGTSPGRRLPHRRSPARSWKCSPRSCRTPVASPSFSTLSRSA
jgi:putative tryptophan/tyrosine transport system substrate-binding protein